MLQEEQEVQELEVRQPLQTQLRRARQRALQQVQVVVEVEVAQQLQQQGVLARPPLQPHVFRVQLFLLQHSVQAGGVHERRDKKLKRQKKTSAICLSSCSS